MRRLQAECVAVNAECGVTGLMLYGCGEFLQILEGPQAEVEALLEDMVDDVRHDDVRVLSRRTPTTRSVFAWSMGVANLKQACGLPEQLDARLHDLGLKCQNAPDDAEAERIIGLMVEAFLNNASIDADEEEQAA